MAQALREQRVLPSRNYDDFKNLHDLILVSTGHHPGILVIRADNNPRHDLKPRDAVRAIANLEAAAYALADQYVALNHWK
jgi:hypothetical protein